jgi:two-component system, chemotaxis family, response regulator Rcp1
VQPETVERVRKVFLIEDNAGDILLIRQILEEQPFPIRVYVARDGDQALFMLAEGRFEPDLILLDLNLPKVSGTWFLEKSKTSVPVVVFSSSSNPADIRNAITLGVREFIQKPTDLQEYASRVDLIVRDWLTMSKLRPEVRC